MKRTTCLFCALFLFLCGCSPTYRTGYAFTAKENNNIANVSGIEYKHIAYEGVLYYLGEIEFVGGIQGETKTTDLSGVTEQNGMFAIKGSQTDNILIRHLPDNEWFAVYRKASLPDFDFSVDNCIRLEFIAGSSFPRDTTHISCGEGIATKAEIGAFLAEVRSQKSPEEAGLYDMVRKPDGMLENCYLYGYLCGFFAEEPNLAVFMEIFSYNDLAFSVAIEGKTYVLPESWLQQFQVSE